MSTTNAITVEDVRAAIARGDPKRAADLLAAVLRADPDCSWAYVETVDLLHRAGHATGADDFARRGLARLPDDAHLHEQFARLLSEDNELASGEWHFRRALELGGRSASVLAGLALNLTRQGRPAEAEPLYAEADRLAPNDQRTLAYWSKALEVQHDLAGAQRRVLHLGRERMRDWIAQNAQANRRIEISRNARPVLQVRKRVTVSGLLFFHSWRIENTNHARAQ